MQHLQKTGGGGPVQLYPPTGRTSAMSTSTATERWISSSEMTTRRLLFFRFSTPSSPAKGPAVIRTRRPTVRNGCGSACGLCETPDRMISISVSGRAVGNPPNPTSRTTLGICTTRIRSRNASRTNTYPGKSGRSNVTRRSFHRRTELYIGRKCSTSRAPSSAATRFSCFAHVYAAYHCACDIACSCSSKTTALCCRSSTLGVLPGITIALATHPPPIGLTQLRPVTYRAMCDLTLLIRATYSRSSGQAARLLACADCQLHPELLARSTPERFHFVTPTASSPSTHRPLPARKHCVGLVGLPLPNALPPAPTRRTSRRPEKSRET